MFVSSRSYFAFAPSAVSSRRTQSSQKDFRKLRLMSPPRWKSHARVRRELQSISSFRQTGIAGSFVDERGLRLGVLADTEGDGVDGEQDLLNVGRGRGTQQHAGERNGSKGSLLGYRQDTEEKGQQ